MSSLDHVWGNRERAGGNAFPGETKVMRQNQQGGGKTAVKEMDPGMTLRDYAAIQAMKGFMRRDCVLYLRSPNTECVAKAAYEMADAMILERAK